MFFFSKVTVMKQFEMQHDGKHDELGKEYEDLWTNVDVILEEIEKNFPEEKKFHAKIYLSHIFVVNSSFSCHNSFLS